MDTGKPTPCDARWRGRQRDSLRKAPQCESESRERKGLEYSVQCLKWLEWIIWDNGGLGRLRSKDRVWEEGEISRAVERNKPESQGLQPSRVRQRDMAMWQRCAGKMPVAEQMELQLPR